MVCKVSYETQKLCVHKLLQSASVSLNTVVKMLLSPKEFSFEENFTSVWNWERKTAESDYQA